MLIQNIINMVNRKLAGEMLSFAELMDFMDETIDDINTKLGSIYPAFSELPDYTTEYTAFPDKYIRQVVVIGTAWKYFTADEEGIDTAMQYQAAYRQNLYYMVRDLIDFVPEEYIRQNDLEEDNRDANGTLEIYEGVNLNGSAWTL